MQWTGYPKDLTGKYGIPKTEAKDFVILSQIYLETLRQRHTIVIRVSLFSLMQREKKSRVICFATLDRL